MFRRTAGRNSSAACLKLRSTVASRRIGRCSRARQDLVFRQLADCVLPFFLPFFLTDSRANRFLRQCTFPGREDDGDGTLEWMAGAIQAHRWSNGSEFLRVQMRRNSHGERQTGILVAKKRRWSIIIVRAQSLVTRLMTKACRPGANWIRPDR